jgi:hypothetical protein
MPGAPYGVVALTNVELCVFAHKPALVSLRAGKLPRRDSPRGTIAKRARFASADESGVWGQMAAAVRSAQRDGAFKPRFSTAAGCRGGFLGVGSAARRAAQTFLRRQTSRMHALRALMKDGLHGVSLNDMGGDKFRTVVDVN